MTFAGATVGTRIVVHGKVVVKLLHAVHRAPVHRRGVTCLRKGTEHDKTRQNERESSSSTQSERGVGEMDMVFQKADEVE